jgi:hypothetical protein
MKSLDQAALPAENWAFVTLTYHMSNVTARESKRHIDRFTKRLVRKFKGLVFGYWKLEPQLRGTPHFHLLLYISGLKHQKVRRWIARNWHDIAEPESPQHAAVLAFQGGRRDWYQRMESWNQVSTYVSKYISKRIIASDFRWDAPGRFWGHINRKALRQHRRCYTFEVSERAAILFNRTLKRFINAQKRSSSDRAVRRPLKRWRTNQSRAAFVRSEVAYRLVEWVAKLEPLSILERGRFGSIAWEKYEGKLIRETDQRANHKRFLAAFARAVDRHRCAPYAGVVSSPPGQFDPRRRACVERFRLQYLPECFREFLIDELVTSFR